jgi:hypothetical protein
VCVSLSPSPSLLWWCCSQQNVRNAKRAWQRKVSLSALMVVHSEQNLRGLSLPMSLSVCWWCNAVSKLRDRCKKSLRNSLTWWSKLCEIWEMQELEKHCPSLCFHGAKLWAESERCKSLTNCDWERQEKKKKAASALRSKVFGKRNCNTQEQKS